MPLVASDFTWQFLFDREIAWPMAHILNPFFLEMLLQNTWLTAFTILFWESVEVFMITLFQGEYLIFVGDEAPIESIGDTLIGDFFQGILGILLARLTIISWKIPSWSPSPIGPYKSIFFKRLIQYLFFVAPFSLLNSNLKVTGAYTVNYGVFLVTITTVFFIWTWYKTNRSPLENQVVWKKYSQWDYERVYLGIMITALIVMSSAFVHFWYSYFVTWIAWIVAMLVCVFVLLSQDRFWELSYAINCGFCRQSYATSISSDTD